MRRKEEKGERRVLARKKIGLFFSFFLLPSSFFLLPFAFPRRPFPADTQ